MKRINKENLRDNKIRLHYLKNELKSVFYKSILNNRFLNLDLRTKIYLKNKNLKSTLTKIRNRCVLTGRGRSVLRDFKISRIMFKNLVSNGIIIGIKKIN